MHPGRIVFLVVIAVVLAGCAAPVPPALAGASPGPTNAPASSAPSPGGVIKDTQLVQDTQGDAVMTDGAEAPRYLDMLGASVELRDGSLTFTQLLAGTGVPYALDLPEGMVALGWSFCIDLDPTQDLRGYPLGSAPMPCELVVQTRWDGSALTGMVFDRRPLADKNEVKTIFLAPVLDGSAISETVPSGLLGGATTFGWSAYIDELGELGTNVLHATDMAPDGGASRPVTWPAN